jgi:predicted phage baseplate assembly protein
MEETAPDIDARSAQDISRQLRKLLAAYAPQWKEATPSGLSAALIGIFSRFSEIVIQRLNKTPDKNLLAYLDMLGLSLLPPQPARAPLTFFLTAGSLTDALVPAGTQVAAKPAEGDAGPVVFETERELSVVAARLDAAVTRDPSRDAFSDQSAIIYPPVPLRVIEGARAFSDRSLIVYAPDSGGAQIFRAENPSGHALYVSHEGFLSHPALKELRVAFQLKQAIANPAPRQVVWELWDGARWAEIPPKPSDPNATPGTTGFVDDNTAALTKPGDVVLTHLPVVQPTPVGDHDGRWLRCRLATAIPPASFQETTTQPAQLPTVSGLSLSALLERPLDSTECGPRLSVEAAFLNYTPVDASKSFLAFGEKPRVGDALYLAQAEAFSSEGAAVTLDIALTRPKTDPVTDNDFPLPVVGHAWEFWDGGAWAALFTSDSKGTVVPANQSFADSTLAFTQSGRVTFTFPSRPARTAVNGVENFWVRVRIISGDYGKDAYYKLKPKPATTTTTSTTTAPDEYALVPASFAPPTVNALAVGYTVRKVEPPDSLVAYNDFNYEFPDAGKPFDPFKTADDTPVSFYFGFTLPTARRAFPNRVVSLYIGVADPYGRSPDVASPASSPRLIWQYWNGAAWSKLTVFDGTSDLAREGMLEFLAPPDFAPHAEFGLQCYWVRVAWASGQYQFNPRLRTLLLNTVMAAQTLTVRDENLGSSDASANQKFVTTAAPVLAGQRLEVREQDRPSSEERARIESEEGPDAITETLDEAERPIEIWIRWHEVPDFYGSGARDRHYVLNHMTGEVSFGDGLNGMIPPRGAGNLRLRFYQTGGGSAGNRAAGAITDLKTTVPYVDSVVNTESAEGGADAESRDSLIRRGPRTIRHRDRAVTQQDYEDLSMMASSAVARVKCFPLQDLAVGIDLNQAQRGVISLVVVPNSTDAKPYPDLELLDTVRSYLERRRATESRLVIVGPKYVRVTVSAEVVPESAAAVGNLEANIVGALEAFLHPLTGGAEGAGWNFGRKPHASDVYAVIESVEGVGYVRALKLSAAMEVGGAEQPVDFEDLSDGQDYFLVYSGKHEVSLLFD